MSETKALVINGSPRGENSNSYKLTAAFLEGMGISDHETLNISEMNIKPCRGCFACWNKTPGVCVIKDDMSSVLDKIMAADLIIWSFPLYYFGLPGALKVLVDRQLPLNLPFMTGQESGGHPSRYDDTGKRHAVISTCGFYTAVGNYAAVDAMFSRYCGEYLDIYCGQGELFGVPELKKRTDEYLATVRQAGAEYKSGDVSPTTRAALDTPLYPQAVFERMADASWGVEPQSGDVHDEATEANESLVFTRQMAALYNTEHYDKDRVIEMRYTDIKQTYQVVLTKEKSVVVTDNFTAPDTTIETPFTVWKSIAAGEIEGSVALAAGQYRVTGDFTLMLKWDDLFGFGTPAPAATAPSPFVKRAKFINGVNIAGAGMAAAFIISGADGWFVVAAELFFAVFWGVTVFLKVPLTCYFSASSYGGEKMLKNPLFTRTNRILTACWAVEFLLMSAALAVCQLYEVNSLLAGIGSYIPAPLLGIFTAWFQKWYPAKAARGRVR
ncbi:MAG: NAD(P)H-dependent oxidoreductase [Oscillospiraceae bacterium]|jgi:multimeric flavodoxin WrbA/putative sterol carrier protein|nr:NAD(P)H-dependent oxidoreductase [Oscillospiraceae bacterium]